MKVRYGTFVLALIVTACGREAPPRSDSVAQGGNTGAEVSWVPELGPVFAVPGDSDNTAIVLFPASPEDTGRVALMRTAGDSSATSRITPTDLQVCGEVATAHLATGGPSGWTVALAPGVTTLRADSIETLSPADSSLLAADVARLASTVPNDPDSRFTGLPFAVVAAHRMKVDSVTVLVARVARRIPQEATPLEERTLLVGERVGSGSFALKYSRRSAGAEDTVEHYALLAVVRAGDRHFMIIESEREAGSRYDILERSAGSWQVRWSRALNC
jgi:hypothetical protein